MSEMSLPVNESADAILERTLGDYISEQTSLVLNSAPCDIPEIKPYRFTMHGTWGPRGSHLKVDVNLDKSLATADEQTDWVAQGNERIAITISGLSDEAFQTSLARFVLERTTACLNRIGDNPIEREAYVARVNSAVRDLGIDLLVVLRGVTGDGVPSIEK